MPSSRDPPLFLSQSPRNLIPLLSLVVTLSESLLRPTQDEGHAEAEGKQRWLHVDGLYSGRKLCGADWAVC